LTRIALSGAAGAGGDAAHHGGGGRWSVLVLALILYMAAIVAFAHAVARD